MTARELFEAARQASFDLWRCDMKYNAMERRALSLGGASDSKVASGSIRDRMGAVDAMVDYDAMMGPKVARWCALLDFAYAVLYGDDWDHGIARSLSISHANVLGCIYGQRMTLMETARKTHWSTRQVCNLRNEAFAYIDKVGFEAAIRGE